MCGCCADEEQEENTPMNKSPLKRNVCCTDILFLILFVAFWAGMIYIAVFSIVEGDSTRLIHGYDSYGNTCNQPNEKILNISRNGMDQSGRPNVFFLDILDPFDSLQLCVSVCPNRKLETKADVQKFTQETGSRLCRYDIDPSDYLNQKFDRVGPCPDLPVYASVPVLNRCVPDPKKIKGQAVNIVHNVTAFLNADDIFRKVISDIVTSWKEMLGLCLIALAISGLMVLMIRYLASVIVWVIVVLAVIGSIVGTAFLWWTYADIKRGLDAKKNLDIPLLSVDISNETAFLVFAIIATVLTVILLLVLLVMRKRISLVVTLFHEAGKCLGSIPLLLIQPIWTSIIMFAFFVYWVIILAFISSAGSPVQTEKNGFLAIEYEPNTKLRVFWWYHVIGLIWTSEFILACQQMVIAGSVALWYFTREKETLSCTVGKSTCRLILHHVGTIAFGSFIILLVKLPRLILMYIQKKCKGSDNIVAQWCLKCCICCLWCLEQCLKFLNQNAYTITAIEGKNFCSAARRAFGIIASNVLRVAAINSVGDFVLFLGKVGVMASTLAVGIVWFKRIEGLHYYFAPVILVAIFAYVVAHCVLSIYEMVVDTLLLCFCEDCQMNDGTPERPYFMSPSLMEYVKDASSQIDALKKGVEGEKVDKVDGEESVPMQDTQN